MAQSSVGKKREIERYHGDPDTRSGARSRKFLDNALTSDKDFMKDAVKSTIGILQRSGQSSIDAKARGLMSQQKKSQASLKSKGIRGK